ncbi:MAG: hypothetical protein NTW87_26650 [Planctomycetota bacterium]|nr:hypothetical protein [Planctomycetota bacterium]
MPQYVLKILIDVAARDDLEARRSAAALVQASLANVPGVREIVLHSSLDNKSIHVNPDGSFPGQWNKGGTPRP